jgi:hypothetical protein
MVTSEEIARTPLFAALAEDDRRRLSQSCADIRLAAEHAVYEGEERALFVVHEALAVSVPRRDTRLFGHLVEEGAFMPAMAVPLAADKLETWEAWLAELGGERKAAFADMNARHGLTEHRAYLQPTPDGNFLVLAIHEGPGSDTFLPSLMQSDDEFDRWFVAALTDIHAIDTSAPPPPVAARRL